MINFFYIDIIGQEDNYGVFSLLDEGHCYFSGTKEQAQSFADEKNNSIQNQEVLMFISEIPQM